MPLVSVNWLWNALSMCVLSGDPVGILITLQCTLQFGWLFAHCIMEVDDDQTAVPGEMKSSGAHNEESSDDEEDDETDKGKILSIIKRRLLSDDIEEIEEAMLSLVGLARHSLVSRLSHF